MKRKIAVVGSRTFPLPAALWDTLDLNQKAEAADVGRALVQNFVANLSPSRHIVVSGGARGVDAWAEEFATERGIETLVIKPDWKKYGKSAGFRRNKLIVAEADDVLAFWDGASRGTLHTVTTAHKMKKPYAVLGPDGAIKVSVDENAYLADEVPAPRFDLP